MGTLTSHNAAETQALGESLARIARPGWVFGLSGPLGAGKTQFVKGIARGLGVRGVVASPTFALVQEYWDGRWPLFHLDLYRLASMAEIAGAGLDDYLFRRDGVAVVEWFERWTGPEPVMLCSVRFDLRSENERLIEYEAPGP